MAHTYSIETLIEKIHNPKTKDYFKEVSLTYHTEAYRSCIVTLYSVVICDLVFKLDELRDIYNDEAAKKILIEISDSQAKNPKNPDWETDLLKLIASRTSLLEQFEIEAIWQLQTYRHLSAHPVLTNASILFTPNRETATAQVKNMLEFVLTKPAFFSKKLASNIIEDVGQNKDRLMLPADLKRYLEARYFKNARPELYHNLFKLLWKFAFKLDNEDCNKNRSINIQTLEIIYDRNRNGIEELIRSESAAYGFINNEEIIEALMTFLFKFPKIYPCLNEEQLVLIDGELERTREYKFMAWFKYEDFDEYLASIKELIQAELAPSFENFKRIMDLAGQLGVRVQILNLGIQIFGKSPSYDAADQRFLTFVEPFLHDMDIHLLTKIVEKINTNGQICLRRKARADNAKIREAMVGINPQFDFSRYPNFD